MKKTFLVLTICFLLTATALSQFEAGQSEIGGSLGLGSTTYVSSSGNFSNSSSYNFFYALFALFLLYF